MKSQITITAKWLLWVRRWAPDMHDLINKEAWARCQGCEPKLIKASGSRAVSIGLGAGLWCHELSERSCCSLASPNSSGHSSELIPTGFGHFVHCSQHPSVRKVCNFCGTNRQHRLSRVASSGLGWKSYLGWLAGTVNAWFQLALAWGLWKEPLC